MKLTPQHPALIEARTIHTKMVFPVPDLESNTKIIKRSTNTKLGKTVTKGRYKGFPIYSVTLQERATCNPLCIHWSDCYGNNMAFAHRFEHGPELISKLRLEIEELSHKHKNGFLVRLHVLGDFYSTAYVEFWERSLRLYPQLHVFGYTAWQKGTPIGDAIDLMMFRSKNKAQIRYSNNSGDINTASSVPTPKTNPLNGSIQCPQQTGKTANCGTCSYCWETDKPVYFQTH